jgi:hypothetical protein
MSRTISSRFLGVRSSGVIFSRCILSTVECVVGCRVGVFFLELLWEVGDLVLGVEVLFELEVRYGLEWCEIEMFGCCWCAS